MTTFADKPTLIGETVVLRPVTASDAEHLWADLDDPEGRRLTGTHATFTREQIDRWVASRGDQDDRLDLAVTDRADGRWLGETVLNEWDADNASCNFRIALSPGARGRGVGGAATVLLLDHAFGALGLHRVALDVYAFNRRAIAMYERVGFVREGVRRQALRWEGEWVDAVIMSVLAPEWATRR